MKKEAVLHIPLSHYAYAEDEQTLVIRIRTAKNDIEKCSLFYGDRVDIQEPIHTKKIGMIKVSSDDLFDYYEGRVKDIYTRVCYYFLLEDKTEILYYYSRGFCDKINCHRTEYFQFPYIRREDIHNPPEWAKDIVMYHIFPDSFASGKRCIEKQQKSCEYKGTSSVTNVGGTLKGIEANLDYLKELGINCIYLNPIFAANSYHKYDTIDYFEIDPCLGTKEDFKRFVKKCHMNGIKVILDGVFNHCGPDFFAFQDVLKNGEKSQYYDWFYHMPIPICFCDPPSYEAFAYVKEMPKLNTGNPKVMEYLCKVGTYWIEETDIDGWRLDVANEVNYDFWRSFKKAVCSKKADCFLIAEIWEDSNVWLQGDQFHSSMNYTFTYLCRDFFATRKINAREFDEQIHKMMMRYPKHISLVQMNFLDSHDVPRFLSYCNGAVKRMRLAFFYLFMSMGIPSVFYGDECYIEGVSEPEYRAPMRWEEENAVAEFSKWINIRKSYQALTKGEYRSFITDTERGIYGFYRIYGEQRLLILINNSDESHVVKLKDDVLDKSIYKNIETMEEADDYVTLVEMSGTVYEVVLESSLT
ncbi:MAG: glycoside hydrolase family 13 protein [Lachnospiraceae bacterium]|nr:glycoside hydrolase family 13 protein [Lachnospiraceae bacterium]